MNYQQHSRFTDPGQFQFLYQDLPDVPAELCEITRGLLLHHLDIANQEKLIPLNRLAELDLRFAERMLEKIISLNSANLLQARQVQTKLIGSCRDFSLLFCSMLRHKNIPARLRYGFSNVHIPDFHHDQVLLEYWDENKNDWCLADARMDDQFKKKYQLPATFEAHDLPYQAFITAGEAWNLCRRKTKTANQFGTGVNKQIGGWWYIRNKLIQDLAALNKMELLPWDSWGLMLQGGLNDFNQDDFMQDAKQVALLDLIAKLISTSKINASTVQSIYLENEALRVHDKIYSYSYFSGINKLVIS